MKYFNEIQVSTKFYRNLVASCNNTRNETSAAIEGSIDDLCNAMADEAESAGWKAPWECRATDGHGNFVGYSEILENGDVLAFTMVKPTQDHGSDSCWIYFNGSRNGFRAWCDSLSNTYSDDTLSEIINNAEIVLGGSYIIDSTETNQRPAELWHESILRMGGETLYEELRRILPILIGQAPFDWGYFKPSHCRNGVYQNATTGWHLVDKDYTDITLNDVYLLKDYFNDTRVISGSILYANDARINAAMDYFESANVCRINLAKATTIFNTSE